MAPASLACLTVNLHVLIHPVRRFGAALSLLLALCAVLTTVSVLQARQLGEPESTAAVAPSRVDTLAPVRQALRRLDETRGLEALHLIVKSDAEKRTLDGELTSQRRAIDNLLAQTPPLAGDSADRQFCAAVRADAAAYWAVQELLLAQSRRMSADPFAAMSVQQLLGASQALFDRLRERLDAWWTHRESRERGTVQAQRAQAAKVLWGIALLGALALGAGIALAFKLARKPESEGIAVASAAVDDAAPAAPGRVEAFQALVDAARQARTAAAPGWAAAAAAAVRTPAGAD